MATTKTKPKPKSKSEPLTVRLHPETADYVRQEAKRTKRSRGAIARTLMDEKARERMFPGVVFTGPDSSRRASVSGTGWDVWQVIETYQSMRSIERMAGDFDLTEHHIKLALAYYERFPEEIDEWIAYKPSFEELKRVLPFLQRA